jgi:uncharacterized OB-fold protein
MSPESGEVAVQRVEPPVTPLTEPFWDATRGREFLLQWCRPCDAPVFYPREVCPRCLEAQLEWRPASGRGTVHAVSVQHRPAMPLPAFTDGPYTVALIELAEGVRIMSNVTGCPPDEVTVGMPVTLTWEALSDGRNLPQFQPARRAGITE